MTPTPAASENVVTDSDVDDQPLAIDGPVPLSDVAETTFTRDPTGVAALDAVLGGGLVVGSVVLIGGEPGCGKSTILLQALDGLAMRVLYATGEESVPQAAARARRVDAASPRVWIVAETDLDEILKHARAIRADVIAIDSIQTLVCADLGGGPGSPGQIRENCNRLMKVAKDPESPMSIILVGHVTNDGALAGPKALRHLVDVVIELECGTRHDGNERILRCAGKNRFGANNVVGYLDMTATGMVPFDDNEPNESELT